MLNTGYQAGIVVSLRAQLNPHFMFNSLNAIQELILKEDNDRSHTYLARFAKLLRMLLENANNPFVPLARELEFLELYLSLEKLRIPDLKYTIEVAPTINTENVKIPNMILQPYIENAIWHGLSLKQDGNRNIQIRVLPTTIGVKYEIEDNGVGREKAAALKSAYRKGHTSKGMELLTKRFRLLNEEYKSDIHTQITDLMQNGAATGTMVSIDVPSILAKEIKLMAS
ncbi:MAG: histidine kinase [Saprospiraceae bacterium]